MHACIHLYIPYMCEFAKIVLFQIRIGNEYLWSDYSDPFRIPLSAKDFSECGELYNMYTTLGITMLTVHTA